MQKPLRKALEIVFETLPSPSRILEIGSRQEKDQEELTDLRSLFKNSQFTGLDMRSGPGVDIIANAEKLPFKDSSFDMVLCLETLEHAEKPHQIVSEIIRVLSKRGVVIVSTQQNFPLHLYPSDYFRYTPYGLKMLFGDLRDFFIFSISPPYMSEVKLNPQSVILLGWKKGNPKLKSKLKKALKNNILRISGHKPYRHRVRDAFLFFKRGLNEFTFKHDVEFFR